MPCISIILQLHVYAHHTHCVYNCRACYILKSWDETSIRRFLLNHIAAMADMEGSSNHSGRKLQVMQCVMRIIDITNTDNIFFDITNPNEYVSLKCVHELKQFGFNFTVDKFKDYDKLKVLKNLWSAHSNNPKALNIIAYICIGYQIDEPIIWNNLLKQMVNCQMLNDLKKIVKVVSNNINLVHLPGLVNAFEYIIRIPLKNLKHDRTPEQDDELGKLLFELQSSPVRSKLNLVELAETCVRFGQIHIGAVFIAFGNEQQRKRIRELIDDRKTDTLKMDILGLEELGIYPTFIKSVCNELKL